jgi:hypothetical protein
MLTHGNLGGRALERGFRLRGRGVRVRVALRGIFGLSALLAGGGALAGAPTSPQPIVLLHSFDAASEGSFPVPGRRWTALPTRSGAC